MMNGYGNWMGMGTGWLGGTLSLLLGLLFFVGVIVLVMWVVRSTRGNGAPSAPSASVGAAAHDDALAIAKRRLASGEIDPDQYEDIRRSLDR